MTSRIINTMKKRRPENTLLEVGERLTEVRNALNLTQVTLCDQINVAPNTYNQWEKGRSLLDPLAASRIAKLYGVTLDYLYIGDPSGLPLHLAQKILGPMSSPSDSDAVDDDAEKTG